MHPVTRLGRVIQQLQSFADLHANELENMAVQLETAGSTDEASQLRAYRDVQRDEAAMVVQELTDIRDEMAAAVQPDEAPAAPPATLGHDPAVNSPKRARWLAEQAAEAERLRQPVSRRDLFGRITNAGEEDSLSS